LAISDGKALRQYVCAQRLSYSSKDSSKDSSKGSTCALNVSLIVVETVVKTVVKAVRVRSASLFSLPHALSLHLSSLRP